MDLKTLHTKFAGLSPALTERSRRLWAATEAVALGHGGIALVERATGISRSTITRGIAELQSGVPVPSGRIRHLGGGRKPKVEEDPTLAADLEALVEPTTAGDPTSPLRWTCKSLRTLAAQLQAMGHQVSHQLVGELLVASGYTLQANRKTREGSSHPDRDAQFCYLNDQVYQFHYEGQPVISVDTKKKELVGDFKNGGRQWRPKGNPEAVRVMTLSFPSKARRSPTGSMTCIATKAGSVSASIMIRPVSPSTPSAGGGKSWAGPPIGRLARC